MGDVPAGLAILKEDIPEGLEPLVDYFDATYISGTYRSVQRPPGPDGTVPPIVHQCSCILTNCVFLHILCRLICMAFMIVP